jgi:hypothetical protein
VTLSKPSLLLTGLNADVHADVRHVHGIVEGSRLYAVWSEETEDSHFHLRTAVYESTVTWRHISDALNVDPTHDALHGQLTTHEGTPFVCFEEEGFIYVKIFNGDIVTPQWTLRSPFGGLRLQPDGWASDPSALWLGDSLFLWWRERDVPSGLYSLQGMQYSESGGWHTFPLSPSLTDEAVETVSCAVPILHQGRLYVSWTEGRGDSHTLHKKPFKFK